MPPLSNPRHEAFIQEYLVNGGNASGAYRKTYPDCSKVSAGVAAANLMRRDEIKARIKECQERLMDMVLKTAKERQQALLERLDKIINVPVENDTVRVADVLKAVELQMKALGMLDPQAGQAHNINLTIEGIERQNRDQWLDQNSPQLRPPNGSG